MSGSVLDPPRADRQIDARIRARRIEVRRSAGRRRLRRLVLLVAATVAASALWALTRSPLLDIDHVAVEGASRTTEAEVVAASALRVGAPLLDADLGAATRGVAALPWVASVDVDRSWRGTITVAVTERVAVAVLRDPAGSGWLVDRTGVVIDAADGADPGLVAVEGLALVPPGQALEPVPVRLLELVQSMPAGVRALVDAVVVDADGEVWLRLHRRDGEVDGDGVARTDGGRVRVGDLRALDEQVLAIATVLAQVDLTDVDVIDVRVPSNPVVTRVVRDVTEEEG